LSRRVCSITILYPFRPFTNPGKRLVSQKPKKRKVEFCVRALCRARPKVSVAILDTSWKAVGARDLSSHAAYTYLHQLVHQPALNNGEQPGTLYEGIRLK
jgi:hypothetical protein